MSEDVDPNESSLRYLHSDGVVSVLDDLGASLFVTAHQSGKLAVVRASEGRLRMLPRTFDRPKGLAVDPQRLAIATKWQIWTLYNSPQVATKMKDADYDACFLPRTSRVTGAIDVHEIAFGTSADGTRNEIWAVNTLFSCLCTLDPQYSFVPRWRPPFVSRVSRQDRCHLNGVAMADGRPKYVTALGETDAPEGWRSAKADGGCIIDVESGDTIVRGLSMPHSPRIHDGRLWALESGRGRLLCVDPTNGRHEVVAQLQGYLRGLAFADRLAFVGRSRIRENKVLGGMPLADGDDERRCGVSVIQIDTGKTIAFLEFEGDVTEIFDVQILRGIRFPAVIGLKKETIERACVVGPQVPIEVEQSRATSPATTVKPLIEQARYLEAQEVLEAAYESNPDDVEPLFKLATQVYPPLADWSRGLPALRQLTQRCPDNSHYHSSLLMSMHYSDLVSMDQITQEHRRWNQVHGSQFKDGAKPLTCDWEPDRPLRIGFVSADFRSHAVAFFLLPVLCHRPEASWEAICYSNVPRERADQYTEQFQSQATDWRDVTQMSDDALIEAIRDDRIDILVDLNGHTAGNRLPVFASKAAPVQVAWLDYVGTTGLETVDYFITDRIHTLKGEERHFSETVWRLPHDYICYEAPQYAPPVGPLPAKANGYVTFGCFNMLSKMTERICERWSMILKRIPDSRLRLNTWALRCPRTQQMIRQRFRRMGIAPQRLQLRPGDDHARYLADYNAVDIGLDSFPYSGGLTTCEALWMGVPVITFGGDRVCSRHSTSHLTHAGLTEFIADSPDDYVERALSAASDLARLEGWRTALRDQVRQSRLMNAQEFTKDLTDALR